MPTENSKRASRVQTCDGETLIDTKIEKQYFFQNDTLVGKSFCWGHSIVSTRNPAVRY